MNIGKDKFKEFIEVYTETYINKMLNDFDKPVPVEIASLIKDVFADGLMHGCTIGTKWPNVYAKLTNTK